MKAIPRCAPPSTPFRVPAVPRPTARNGPTPCTAPTTISHRSQESSLTMLDKTTSTPPAPVTFAFVIVSEFAGEDLEIKCYQTLSEIEDFVHTTFSCLDRDASVSIAFTPTRKGRRAQHH